MVVRERSSSNTWTKGSGWVQTSTSVVDRNQMSQEKRDTNGKWSNKGSSVLFNSHQQDGDTQESSGKGFNKDTSRLGATTTQTVGKGNWAWGHGRSGTSSSHTSNHLRKHHQGTSDRWNGTGQDKSQSDSWVQVTTGNSEKEENSNHDTETKTKRNHNQLLRVGAKTLWNVRILVSDLSNDKGSP